jgi:hypothetical protein
MALTLFASGTSTVATGANTVWSAPTNDLGVYVATLDLHLLDGCTVAVRWGVDYASSSSRGCWFSGEFNVADPTLEGLLTPPVPIARAGGLFLDVVTGTPAGDIEWDIFRL